MSDAKTKLDWLLDCAKYFENRDTGGEDARHWANVYNAENARAIHTAWTADRDRAEKAEEQADTFAKQRDVQLGKTIDATARAEKAEARVKVLEAALEPFASREPKGNYMTVSVYASDIRAARAAKEQS